MFGSTLFGKPKEGLPEGRVKRNLAFNSGGFLLVSFLLVLAKRMKNFANAKRTDIGRVGGFSLDVLYLWEQSNCWGLPGTNYVGLPGSNSVEYWHMLYHSAISVSYNRLFKISI